MVDLSQEIIVAKKLLGPTDFKDLFSTPATPPPAAKQVNRRKPKKVFTKAEKTVIKQKKRAHAAKIMPAHIWLSFQHNINGVQYGPGKVVVSKGLADVLLENERNVKKTEENFYGTKAVIIGPRGPRGYRARQVAPEMFDTGGYMNVAPLTTLSKQGDEI